MEINYTLLIQLGIYLGLFFVLKAFYFEPILALLNRRNSLTKGKEIEAQELSKKLESLRLQYDARMKEVKESIEAHRLAALQRVKSSADERIHSAKTKMEKDLWNYQDSLEKEAKVLRSKFPSLASDLKKEILEAVLSSRVVRI